MVNILTVDVEDYFQVENFKKVIKFSEWEKYESRVEKNTEKILEILAEKNVKATFFVVGWIAERFPHLIKRIHNEGHKIASHTYKHQLIYTQTPQEFRSDLRKSKIILEDIIQEKILGFRAPSYSITKNSLWALEILMEEGFSYDSSIFPIYHDRGGLPFAERFPFKIYNHKYYIWEFPISTFKILNQNIPFSGGGYLRFFPYRVISWMIKRLNQKNRPAIVYIHPWELDPYQPKIKVNFLCKVRHYYNLEKTEKKLRKLLDDFKFVSVEDFINLGIKTKKLKLKDLYKYE